MVQKCAYDSERVNLITIWPIFVTCVPKSRHRHIICDARSVAFLLDILKYSFYISVAVSILQPFESIFFITVFTFSHFSL